jgi:hypothetical protein
MNVLRQHLLAVRLPLISLTAVFASLTATASHSFPLRQTKASVPETIVFWSPNFPVADTASPDRAALASALPNAAFIAEDKLSESLGENSARLLILPFGSAFPADLWPAIHNFLERGGNLLVIGGRPFTRPAFKENGEWQLHAANQAYARTLFLNDYQQTPGSAEASFAPNDDFSFLQIPRFAWQQAWSATVRLSDESLYPREGSAGSIDARLDPLVWGGANGRKLSAPLIEIDHLQNQFEGGRWILLNADLAADFWTSNAAHELIPLLAKRAVEGAEDFRVEPTSATVLPGESITLNIHWRRFVAKPPSMRVEWTCALLHNQSRTNASEAQQANCGTQSQMEAAPAAFPFVAQITLPATTTPGLHSIKLKLFENNELHATFHTAVWLSDPQSLRTAPKIAVSTNYFTRDGKPFLVAGTTYMASDVQRQFLMRPNPFVWDRDMAQIEAAGINTIRTGWWTGWDQVMKESGDVREEALRNIEAFLMTARAHNLAVQFTFFAFTPEIFGGENPYLDPQAIERQKELITAVVERFKDVPFVSWDLINEPSFSNPRKTWQTRPNGDRFELEAWNQWLQKRYPTRAALADAWRSVVPPDNEPAALPADEEFSSAAGYEAWPANNSLRALDYEFFAQDAFANWAATMRDAIRATGSRQLITVGEDEGGGEDRPSPAFFGSTLDFTTTHSWWAQDALLWDSLVATIPGKPMLVQETGVSHEVQMDGSARRTLAEEASLFARKLAIAAGSGAGAIEWLWNVNDYMRDDREATIGAIRPDGTEKPEAEVLRKFAAFAAAASPHLSSAAPPQVAIMTSQELQFSPLRNLALEAQQKSIRALNYNLGIPTYVIPENLATQMLGVTASAQPKLVVLPSPQALGDSAWQALLKYVSAGGTLLISGSAERDARWNITHRFADLGIPAAPASLLLRGAAQQIGDSTLPLSFDSQSQSSAEYLHFPDGATFHRFTHGAGRIFVAAQPVELADGLDPATNLYSWALSEVGLHPAFEGKVPPSVLIRPLEFQDSILYLIVSESSLNVALDLRDRATGARITMSLPAGASRLLLLDKKSGRATAQFAP